MSPIIFDYQLDAINLSGPDIYIWEHCKEYLQLFHTLPSLQGPLGRIVHSLFYFKDPVVWIHLSADL
jgi:hypothetical protein